MTCGKSPTWVMTNPNAGHGHTGYCEEHTQALADFLWANGVLGEYGASQPSDVPCNFDEADKITRWPKILENLAWARIG
jgi:hypothetical protein